MLFNLKLSRAISHLVNIEAKTLGNLVLARRDSFLSRSKVAGVQQLKNFLRTTSMTYPSLFAGQLTPVAEELSERKRRQSVLSNRTSSTSTVTASQQVQSTRCGALPAKRYGSRHPFSSSASHQITPGKPQGCQAQGGPAKKPPSACLSWIPGGPWQRTFRCFNFSNMVFGSALSLSPVDHKSDSLFAARGQQQERASKHQDSLRVGEGGHRESVKQVVSRV